MKCRSTVQAGGKQALELMVSPSVTCFLAVAHAALCPQEELRLCASSVGRGRLVALESPGPGILPARLREIAAPRTLLPHELCQSLQLTPAGWIPGWQ